jgi:hypothetical protein
MMGEPALLEDPASDAPADFAGTLRHQQAMVFSRACPYADPGRSCDVNLSLGYVARCTLVLVPHGGP